MTNVDKVISRLNEEIDTQERSIAHINRQIVVYKQNLRDEENNLSLAIEYQEQLKRALDRLKK